MAVERARAALGSAVVAVTAQARLAAAAMAAAAKARTQSLHHR